MTKARLQVLALLTIAAVVALLMIYNCDPARADGEPVWMSGGSWSVPISGATPTAMFELHWDESSVLSNVVSGWVEYDDLELEGNTRVLNHGDLWVTVQLFQGGAYAEEVWSARITGGNTHPVQFRFYHYHHEHRIEVRVVDLATGGQLALLNIDASVYGSPQVTSLTSSKTCYTTEQESKAVVLFTSPGAVGFFDGSPVLESSCGNVRVISELVEETRLWRVTFPVVPVYYTFLPLTTSNFNANPCKCYDDLYDCTDFATQYEAQACYDHCVSLGHGDVHRLDKEKNGLACEDLP